MVDLQDLQQRHCSIDYRRLTASKPRMPSSTALLRNQSRGRPVFTAEEWEEAERAYEEAERFAARLYNVMFKGELRPADMDTHCRVSKKNSEEPQPRIPEPVIYLVSLIDHVHELDRTKKQPWDFWAQMFIFTAAMIVGPEASIHALYNRFGPSILRQSLNKQRGPTSVRNQDDERIRICIDAIMWATGDSVRRACQKLAKMGLQTHKDGAQGRVCVNLNNSETIRKRYMRSDVHRYCEHDLSLMFYEKEMLRLKLLWHWSGEPPFLNWLKQLISQYPTDPDTKRFFEPVG